MKLTSLLYRAARFSRDVEVLSHGKPEGIIKRLVNKWLGRRMHSKGWLK